MKYQIMSLLLINIQSVSLSARLSVSLCLSVSLFVCLSLLPLERVVSVVGGAGLESGSPLVKKSARGIRKSRQTTTRILHTFTFTEIQREMMICYYSIVNIGAAENRHTASSSFSPLHGTFLIQ